MSYEVTFRPQAEADLASLVAYIRTQRGEFSVALGYLKRIRAFCEGLSQFPERGRKRDDIRQGLRIAAFERRVVVAYVIEGSRVRIARVFYGGRDYEALLGDELA